MLEQIEESANIHDSGQHIVRIQELYTVGNEDEAAEIIHESNLSSFTHAPKGGWTLPVVNQRTRQLKKMIDDADAKGLPTGEIRKALQAVRDKINQVVPVRAANDTPAPLTQEEITQQVRECILAGFKEEARREFGELYMNMHPGRHEAIKEAVEGKRKPIEVFED